MVKIDCVEHRDLCAEQVIRAFPTLRLYKSGKAIAPDYREDRYAGREYGKEGVSHLMERLERRKQTSF